MKPVTEVMGVEAEVLGPRILLEMEPAIKMESNFIVPPENMRDDTPYRIGKVVQVGPDCAADVLLGARAIVTQFSGLHLKEGGNHNEESTYWIVNDGDVQAWLGAKQ